MWFLWLLLGLVIGGGAIWLLVARESDQRVAEVEARVQGELTQANRNAQEADQAHKETKDRLIALQMEHQKQTAELETVRTALEAARAAAAERVPETDGAASPASLPKAADHGAVPADLKRIKGIGPALERRLNDLGIRNLEQLAALSQDDVEKINAHLEFPGRIQRERWIEQARALLGR